MSSSNIMTSKGTLRQVFTRVYRLEIQSVMLVFATQLCCPSNLLSRSTVPPLSCVKKYTRIQCVKGRVWGSGPQKDKHLPQSPFTSHFFRFRHFALSSLILIFLRKALTKIFRRCERHIPEAPPPPPDP